MFFCEGITRNMTAKKKNFLSLLSFFKHKKRSVRKFPSEVREGIGEERGNKEKRNEKPNEWEY